MLTYPALVDEKAARVVAGVVALTLVVALLTGALWLSVPLAYGYLARTLTGPVLSPLARVAGDLVAPRLGAPKRVSGPPKRFASGMGAAFSTGGMLAWLLGAPTVAGVLLAALMLAATLECAFAFCLGCKVFGLLVRAGLVSDDVCAECADIWSRIPRTPAGKPSTPV